MTPALPRALREGVASLIDQIAPAELTRQSQKLSATYRSEGASNRAIRDDADVAAYLATRLPATYAAMAAALDAVAERAPGFSPKCLVDVGAGPGTASWAAAELWPDLRSITMIDPNPQFLGATRALAAASGSELLRNAHILAGEVAALDAAVYDVVLAGYVFAELPAAAIESAIRVLWRSCGGALVIVEPGTPAGFARILRARTLLIAFGARIVAPCPDGYPCPIAAPDWCHFSVRLPRSRAHLRAKQATAPFEDEKFSYLAVARETVPISRTNARILAEPHVTKASVRLKLCSDGRIAEHCVPRGDKVPYKRFAKSKWGDAV